MAVVASATGAAVFGLSGVAAGLAGGALLGAGIGGLYSAFTGDGDILNSMLTGGLIGGAAGGIGAAVAPAATTTAGGLTATGAGSLYPTTAATAVPALTGGGGLTAASVPSLAGSAALGGATAAAPVATGVGGLTAASVPSLVGTLGTTGAVAPTAAGLTGGQMLGYGLAGTTAMQLLGGRKGGTAPASATDPGMIRPYTFSPNQTAATGVYPSPYATAQYDAAGMPIMDTRERNYFDQKYTALTPYSARVGTENPNKPIGAANGGLMAIGGPVERMSQNVMGGQGNMFPLSQQEHTNFATPTQMPASAEVIRSDYDAKTQPYTGVMMANGGKARGSKDDDNFSFDDLTKAQKEYYLDLMASPMKGEMPLGSNIGSENTLEKYMMSQAPQGFTGRIGATRVNDDGSNLRAGLSGIAMAQPGKPGITAIPGAYDVGYRSPRKSDEDSYLDLSAYRSINSVPGRGYDRGVNARYTIPFADGGDVMGYDLGGYSDGGRLLRGPGDGVSDDIPATIAGKQPARLADGEFVIPARIVSEIGNGSTDAGAKRLYAMMDKIQAGRKKTIGKKNIAKDTKAKKHLLA
jgi:hypothetical protein